MTAKSPTMGVKSREIIGTEQFTQRREVFDKHDTVFMPPASPTALLPASDVEPIVTSNHGKTTSNFKRNAPAYSSMRESRTEEQIDFRPRKYSDNFYSELNQSDDVDYRRTMTERTRRLSKLRRDFMTSNLHEPGTDSPFTRAGTRASLPAKSLSPTSPILKYKIESPNLYKFPFAEPYTTPTPTRKVRLELGSSEVDGGKENEDPDRTRHQSLPNNNNNTKIDHQKLFEELVKRYSPQRKPIDWSLPPTKPRGPRVIGSVPKSSADSVGSAEKKYIDDKSDKHGDDEVFEKKENDTRNDSAKKDINDKKIEQNNKQTDVMQNGVENPRASDSEEFKTALAELVEKNDEVPELKFQRQLSKESGKKPNAEHDHVVDLTIPALIQKMTTEGEDLENHSKETKKVKRKRSFLDKLLGRNKKDK